jgi:hypothetical protein
MALLQEDATHLDRAHGDGVRVLLPDSNDVSIVRSDSAVRA